MVTLGRAGIGAEEIQCGPVGKHHRIAFQLHFHFFGEVDDVLLKDVGLCLAGGKENLVTSGTREPAKKESTTVKRKRRTKKQKKEPEAKQGDYLVGTDENVLVLNRTYANRGNAERAAKMQWERLQRGVASFSLQLAEGRADLYTEMPVKVSGFKQPIDDAEWTITTLTHTVSPDNGFTTSLELEVRIDDFEME